MKRVGTGLGYRVHYAPRGLPKFRAVVGGADLKLIDRVDAVGVGGGRAAARLGKESLVVIGSVDGIVVVEAEMPR